MKQSTHLPHDLAKSHKGRRSDVCFLLFSALLVGWKLLLTAAQHADIQVNATIDDALMFTAARYVATGNWLGPFGWVTYGKHMFFSVWLAGIMLSGINYLIAGQLLWLAAVLLAVWALAPVFRARWQQFLLFACLWMLPYSYAQYSLRVYRDNIFPALCLMCFAGVAGYALRANSRRSWGFGVLAGVGLGLAWLTREDGIWLLPFVGCATLVGIACAFWQKDSLRRKLNSLVAPLLCAVVALALICGYCYMNYRYYGVFEISDFTSSAFEQAVGSWIRCDDEPHDGILVCSESRAQIYAVSPLSARLGKQLESGNYYGAYGFGNEAAEFKSGGLCWAMKKAAYDAGLYHDATSEREFWLALAAEVNAAVDAGLVETSRGETVTSLMPFYSEYLPAVAAEFGSSLRVLLGFEQCFPQTAFNNVFAEDAAKWEALLNCKSGYSLFFQGEHDNILYTPLQKLSIFGFELNTWVYRILALPALLLALLRTVREIAAGLKKDGSRLLLCSGILALGFALSLLLRTGIAAYMEAVSFQIGTYLLYLSPAGPLIGLLIAYGISGATQRINNIKQHPLS
ncbi:MAG: hypothetical protein IKV55_00975 [Oscillospiraceae bacterium]|nr:hypothetical protein [Oscillospiraceae bacterium]